MDALKQIRWRRDCVSFKATTLGGRKKKASEGGKMQTASDVLPNHRLYSSSIPHWHFGSHSRCFAPPRIRRQLTIQNALKRSEKEAAVEKLTKAFEESTAVFGIRFKHIGVKKFQDFRRTLPLEGSHMYVVKNNLLKIAADKVDGWGEIKQAAKGENAWIFAAEDQVADCVKAFIDFEKALIADQGKDKKGKVKPTDITGGVLDGLFLDYASVKKLEKMPTKLELIRDAAIMIKKMPTYVALSIKAVPSKLARSINLLAEGDEDKNRLVGDVFPKASSEAS